MAEKFKQHTHHPCYLGGEYVATKAHKPHKPMEKQPTSDILDNPLFTFPHPLTPVAME